MVVYNIEDIRNKIICGNALEELKKFPDNSIDAIVTSPPYYGLRDYGEETNVEWPDGWWGQLGQEPSLSLYIDHLLLITKELYRILKPSGVMWWNHGDSYGSSSSTIPYKHLGLQNYRLATRMTDEQGWIPRNIVVWWSVRDRLTNQYEPIFMFTKTTKYCFDLDSIRLKQMPTNINHDTIRIDKAEQSIWIENSEEEIMDYIIRKRRELSQVPPQSKFATKPLDSAAPQARIIRLVLNGKISQSDVEKALSVSVYLKQKLKESGLTRQQLAEISGISKNWLSQYITTSFTRLTLPNREVWDILKPILKLGEYEDYVDEKLYRRFSFLHPNGKNPGDVWPVSLAGIRAQHFAPFPTHLVRQMIISGCPDKVCKSCRQPRSVGNFNGCQCDGEWEPGIVLDPFMGSGTVAVVAEQLGRYYVGIEKNPQYILIAHKRLSKQETLGL